MLPSSQSKSLHNDVMIEKSLKFGYREIQNYQFRTLNEAFDV